MAGRMVRTLLFSDIEGSTALLGRVGDRYAELLGQHQAIMRRAIAAAGGEEQGTEGDSFFVTFESPSAALAAAVQAQREHAATEWPADAVVRARMGLHVGELTETDAGLVGMAIHHAARIGASGHGDQIVVSEAVHSLAGKLPDGVELVDLGRHALRDVGLTTLFQVAHPELRSDFPPLRSLRSAESNRLRSNLPMQLSSFVGRNRELSELRDLIASARLVTLTGAGGSGKTRLATELATEFLDDEHDGVWFAALAPLTHPDSVLAEVAQVLGVQGSLDRPASDLFAHLRDNAFLLVIDNCEHLLEPAARVVDALLRVCPAARVVATSRERLDVTGEATYRVPTMIASGPDAGRSDAVQLFIDRATAQRAGFTLDDATSASVAAICQRLDGLPLAIELAAARLGSMSVADVERRLDDRFHLLTRGSRDAMPRQQTLAALIDWSFELLTPDEATLFTSLGVFRGGWTLDAVEAIVAAAHPELDDIAELQSSLVDKSLVQLDLLDNEGRYFLLETIGAYARARLATDDRQVVTRLNDAHLDHYLGVVESVYGGRMQDNRQLSIERVDLEIENLHAALDWSIEQRLAESGLRLVKAIGWSRNRSDRRFDDKIGRLVEMSDECEPLLRVKAHLQSLFHNTFRSVQIREHHADRALALAQQSGDQWWIAEALDEQAWMTFLGGGGAAAIPFVEEAVRAADASGDPYMIADCRRALGWHLLQAGRVDEALHALEAALSKADYESASLPRAHITLQLAEAEFIAGHIERAASLLEQFVETSLSDPFIRFMRTGTNGALGVVRTAQGRSAEALRLISQSLEAAALDGELDFTALPIFALAGVAASVGSFAEAAQLLGIADRRLAEALIACPMQPYLWAADQTRAALAAGLTADEVDRLHQLGRSLSMDTNVAAALTIAAALPVE